MENRKALIYLDHILESILYIEKYTKNTSKNKFFRYVGLQDKVIRRLEIIGEAVKHLPLSIRKDNKKIPRKKIAGMRDVLIHDYFEVELDLAWEVVRKDIPILKKQIQKIAKNLTFEQK